MIVLACVAVVALVAIVFGIARFTAGRADRRSVDGYEHVLDVLGHVAKTSETPTATEASGSIEVAPVHVHVAPEISARRVAIPAQSVAPARVRLDPPIVPGSDRLPVFSDLAPAESLENPDRDLGVVWRHRSNRRGSARTMRAPKAEGSIPQTEAEATAPVRAGIDRRGLHRRVALVRASVAVAVIAGTVVGISAVLRGSTNPRPSTSGTSQGHHPKAHPTATSVPITPPSVPGTLVSYFAPSETYDLSFSATASCWIGVESTAKGPYLWMTTLSRGGSSIEHANGTVVVRIGAPSSVSVSINGSPVALPSTHGQPFDVAFVPQQPA